ncbi:xylan glycosyltransferase MUCI21-like [Vicia villosa]|uniref:xylan glycosyltransferase MUCI21-like n=1 Tax=Vicia villosa TaxID=3911 RepID=UPI00273BC8E0|nr:xylan glycosyltransferase MUCI21-like [Vicia villosa]
MEGKTVLLSIWGTWFALLGLIFFLQLTFVRDVTKQMFSNLHRNLDLKVNTTLITCDRSNEDYDICTMNGPTLLDQTSLTLFTLNPSRTQPHFHVKIQPYPLKNSKDAMSSISEFTLTSHPQKYSSQCGVTHHSPALVFSGSGYTGNFYHDMNEIFIPLFITINSLSHDQDVILVIIDSKDWWLKKYADLLSAFSPHHIIIKTNNLTTTHCFPSAIIGLIKHGQLIINPKLLPNPKTLFDFHAFLENAYIKKDTSPMYSANTNTSRPLLTLVGRKGNSRVILNQEEVIKLAEDIGFNVHVLETTKDSSVAETYRLIHSSHVMLGVHGAGLTNLLFLRQGSVSVQIVPIGLEWASETYYNKPTKILGLEYVEYKVGANESSLSWKYGADSLVIEDPETFRDGKWANQLVYLKKQNVIIDLIRFKKCLIEVYKKAILFMNTSGS